MPEHFEDNTEALMMHIYLCCSIGRSDNIPLEAQRLLELVPSMVENMCEGRNINFGLRASDTQSMN